MMNDHDKLIHYSAVMGVAMERNDVDLANDAWRSLPEHIQEKLEEKEEYIREEIE